MSTSKVTKVSFNETDIPLLDSIVFDANGGSIGEIIKRRLYELEAYKFVLAQIRPNTGSMQAQCRPEPDSALPEDEELKIDWDKINEKLS